MSVTSHDVARLAGVSQATVSRALSDHPKVSPRTKHLVREAAAQLGYVPSEAGRSLSSGRSRRVGLLVTDLDNQFYAQLIPPAHRELERYGYQLMLHTESGEDAAIADRLIAGGLAGVILATATLDSATPARLHDRSVPFVYFNRTGSFVEADATVVDPVPGHEAAVEHIVAAGHRRVAAILGPENTSTGRAREAALRNALRRHGIHLPAHLVRRGGYDTETGDRAMTELLADARPTLVFAANDVVAIGALNALRRAGAVPARDVSIIGFDDLPPARWDIIQLSSIAYDLEAMMRETARLITARLEGSTDAFHSATFSTRYVDRSTVGVLPSAGG
ncbi:MULTISPECIES: LacI family DNA-binding transcriptional regulator [Microbacterium]|uniref:LacI family DNA-binding transcriptional regulator n=1 Tax=Microbacterium TaxID=33882 RepID=UPI002789C370|nr:MULTISPECIES: LacI family DNA-binding transcriptional regulator [Microbacterium]MDQ1082484.1 LacI family transcriptional regulator [Microbacterium sp. SORGH_AS_0344]MDQ1168745.1 LacI family transcriptional regulator [Microbacterium proteolyticum]